MDNRGKIFDALLEMHGTGLVAAGAAATPIDLGVGAPLSGNAGYTEGKLILDITACAIATVNDYEIWFQGSHDSTFTTFHTFFAVKFGAIATGTGASGSPSGVIGKLNVSSEATWPGPASLPLRMVYPFCNDFAGTVYRWLRVYTATSTTPGAGINYYAFITK